MLKIKFLKGKSKTWIFCFIFCSMQLYTLTRDFASFDVRTEIVHNFSQPIEFPDIDFFFPITTVLNFSAFYLRRPTELVHQCKTLFNKPNVTINSVQEFDQHCSNLSLLVTQSSTWLPALLTVGDVEELTKDPREIIDRVNNLDGIRYDMLRSKICTKQRFLCGFGIFVRISCRNGSLPLLIKGTSGLGGNNFILNIQHRIDRTFGFRFAFHKRGVRNKASDYLFIEPSKDHFYSVIAYFSRQVTTSLPWPYKTKCLNYDKGKILTECLNKHLRNLSIPTIALDAVIPFKKYPKNTRFINGYLATSGAFMNFLNKCTKLIEKPECREVFFHTSAKVYIDEASIAAATSTTIIVDRPIEPDLYIIAHEKLTLTELLVALYSVLGIYFGINVYDKLKLRLEGLNKCFKKSDKEQKLGPKARAFIVVDPDRTFPLYY